jgi:hypothetical protein
MNSRKSASLNDNIDADPAVLFDAHITVSVIQQSTT